MEDTCICGHHIGNHCQFPGERCHVIVMKDGKNQFCACEYFEKPETGMTLAKQIELFKRRQRKK